MKQQVFHYTLPKKPIVTQDVIVSSIKVSEEDIVYPCHMFIDQATDGAYSIFDDRRRLIRSGTFTIEDGESLQEFKFSLRDVLVELIKEYQIGVVWYEEVYEKANHWTTEVLHYIKHTISDLAYEFDNEIMVLGLDHARWKSLLAYPKKFNRNRDDKEQVAEFVKKHYPLLNLPEDVMDSIGMGLAIIWKSNSKKSYYNARINKRLPIHHEVFVLHEGEDIVDRIKGLGVRFTRKLDDSSKEALANSIYEFEYDEKYDVQLNCRYVLNFRDTVCWAEIPFHRNFGQILLHYEIIPKELKDGDRIVVVASRKR